MSSKLPLATPFSEGVVRLNKDLGGDSAYPAVIGIQGRPISSTTPTDGYVLMWNATDGKWEAMHVAVSFADLSTDGYVIGLQGRSVVPTAPADGNVLTWKASD